MALSARELQSGKGRHVMYSVTITTSNESVKCGTDCAVYLTIHGVNGHTSVHSLRPLAVVSSKTFSAGAVDKFNIQDTDVISPPPPPHTHTPSFPPPLALQNKRFPNHLPAIFLTPLPPLLQVGQIQRITLTLAQGGMALDWKPCQVQSLLSLLLLPIQPLLTSLSDFESRFACLALVYRALFRSPLK
jgi:hypothetical protein